MISVKVFSQNVLAFTDNNLDFGDVYIGYSSTVEHIDPGAAKFRFEQSVSGNPFVEITFTLPNSLVNGTYNIPINFSPATSAYSFTDSPSGRTSFDPRNTLATRLQRNRVLYIWLGGSINIPVSSIPGTYSSTITVTIVVP